MTHALIELFLELNSIECLRSLDGPISVNFYNYLFAVEYKTILTPYFVQKL